MACNKTCQYFHKSTSLTVTSTDLVVTATNSTNLTANQPYCLVICQNPSNVATTPLPVLITINGTNIPVVNAYNVAITSDLLPCRKKLLGHYVTSGENTYLQIANLPAICNCGSN